MDILSPQEKSLDRVTEELISDVTGLARKINEQRPIPSEVIENIQAELLGERVYNSNAIEGNTLTLRETRSILDAGAVIDVGRKREATEALNLASAIADVQQLVADCSAWSSLDRFLAVHKTLLAGVDDEAAGAIRSERVVIAGAKHQPPNSERVHALLDLFFGELREARDVEPVWLATWAHWTIARIHPFRDGNGRMARLWQDLILFGNQLTAALIRLEDRNEYYRALAAADDGEFNPLTQLVARSLGRVLQIYVNAQREFDELRGWAANLVGAAHARDVEDRKLEYLRWARHMELLRDAFERCATQITSASDGTIEIQARTFELIDQSTWETLRSGGDAVSSWFFWMNFKRSGERSRYCFFFGHHIDSPRAPVEPGIGPSVCLLVSEQVGNAEPRTLTEPDGSPVTLRELLIANDRIVLKRVDPARGTLVYDRNVDPLAVAREFVQQVLLSQSG